MAKPAPHDTVLAALSAQRQLLGLAAAESVGPEQALALLVDLVCQGLDRDLAPDPAAARIAVRALAHRLAAQAPGGTVEVRVPPYVAVQCVEGPRHTRGTPPNTIETDPLTFLRLATGRVSWADGVADGRVRASGSRADLTAWLPLR
ncbi:MAG: sterol carrier family protein [Mycobacteriales bacterium]